MGFLDELKKFTHPYPDEDESSEEYDEEVRDRETLPEERRPRVEDRRGKVLSIHAASQLRVVLVKPERFDSAPEIADHLKQKQTVVLNLESTEREAARRLVDFLSGVAYAGDGKIKKIAVNTYLITPYHVDIEGDLIDELESSGFRF